MKFNKTQVKSENAVLLNYDELGLYLQKLSFILLK